jgi:uncharacterized protein HemX
LLKTNATALSNSSSHALGTATSTSAAEPSILNSKSSAGSIAGAVIGVFLALALAVAALLLQRRKRNRNRSEKDENSDPWHKSELEANSLLPFELPADNDIKELASVEAPVELPGTAPVPRLVENSLTTSLSEEDHLTRDHLVTTSTVRSPTEVPVTHLLSE